MQASLKRLFSASGGRHTSFAIIDTCIVRVHSGRGGDGAISYIKHSKPGLEGPGLPCGGAGGRGGSIVITADSSFPCLKHIIPQIKAQDAMDGKKRRFTGQSGTDVVIKVPTGTIVWNIDEPNRLNNIPPSECLQYQSSG